MKKKSLLVFSLFALTLAGCSGDKHHYGPWSSDEEGHWKTCTDSGCGEISQLGDHSFGEWEVVSDPTFEEEGYKERECTVCGYVESEDIEKLEHEYARTWSSDATHHWHECLDDGYAGKNNGSRVGEHAFEWDTLEKPTENETGLAGNSCIICNYGSDTYTLPKLNETNYSKSVSVEGGYSVTSWTLLDTSTIPEFIYEERAPMFEFGENYTVASFNAAFEGDLLASFDEENNLISIEVLKEGGYTLNGRIKSSIQDLALEISGKPLTIVSPGGQNSDAITVQGNVTIKNDLTAYIANHKASTLDNTAIVGKQVTIAENANVDLSNFTYGFYLIEGILNVNGNLNAGAVREVVYGSTGKEVTINPNKVVWMNDVPVEEAPTMGSFGQHLIVSDDKGANLESYLSSFEFAEMISEPTLSEAGTIKVKCAKCSSDFSKEVSIPMLSDVDYNLTPITVYNSSDKKVYDTTSYVLKDDSYGIILIEKEAREITNYFTAGSSYYSIDTWNALFTNQHSVETTVGGKKVFTMTLSGDQTLFANDGHQGAFDGTLDFTKYSKVIINGEGTLNVSFSNPYDGIIGNALEIGSGVTMNVTGADNQNKSGINFHDSLTINGTLNVSGFGYGQCCVDPTTADGTITITVNEGAKYKIYNCAQAIGSWNKGARVHMIVKGDLDIDMAVTGGSALILNNNSKFEALGNAKVSIINSWNVIQADTGTAHGVHVIISDNADVKFVANNNAVFRFERFIVGNVNPNDESQVTQCNAKVTLKSKGNTLVSQDSDVDTKWEFCLYSSQEVQFEAISDSPRTKKGVEFRWKKCSCWILSAVTFKNYDYALWDEYSVYSCGGNGAIHLNDTNHVAGGAGSQANGFDTKFSAAE